MRQVILAFIIGFTVTACTERAVRNGGTSALERRCEPVLAEILQIQDLRLLNNHALNHKRAEGVLTPDDVESWKTVEEELGSRVNHLYNVADRRKCFDGVEQMFLTFS